MKLLVISFLIFIGLSSCKVKKYTEYKPHYLSKNNEHKYYGKTELDSVEFKNTLQVLVFYGEDYKIKNDSVILITKKLTKDWELLWNYTTKANDIKWLNTHKAK